MSKSKRQFIMGPWKNRICAGLLSAGVKSGNSDKEGGSSSSTGQQAPEAGNVSILDGIF